jgi:tRNA threonylcarbamoyladenosine biosynthesis protein TsaB
LTIVGFDTSLATTSACVLLDDGRSFANSRYTEERLLGPPRHSAELLPKLESLLREASLDWRQVDSIAVGIGPGTFTGLRIGVSTARGLAQALGVQLRPVSSLQALAAGAKDAGVEAGRPVLSVIDARRGQVFAALWEPDHPPAAIWEPMVLDPSELLSRVSALDRSPVCVGDWALKSRAELAGTGAYVPSADSGVHAVDGLQLCRLAMNVDGVDPVAVFPLYLRQPDAEVNRRIALGKASDSPD